MYNNFVVFTIGISTKKTFKFYKVVQRQYSGEVAYLHYFVAKLFKILHANFYQNRPSFTEDMTNTFWLIFFLGHVKNIYVRTEILACHGGAMGMYHCA